MTRLGQQSTTGYSCAVFVTATACDSCPTEYMGLPLYDQTVVPKGQNFADWDSCMSTGTSSSVSSTNWYVDVFIKMAAGNWVYVADNLSETSPYCIPYGNFNPSLQQILGGPYPTEQECNSGKDSMHGGPYCIPLAENDPDLYEICGGPYYSQSQCGTGCNPSNSSSSSSSSSATTAPDPTCNPSYSIITLPDGSTALELACGGSSSGSQTPPGQGSSGSCQMLDSPPTQGIFCTDGTRVGTVFFLPDISACSWIPYENITGFCPSSSSASTPCEDSVRYCLYSDYASSAVFAMTNKPPPCKYKKYCLPTGCEELCEDPKWGTPVTSCDPKCCSDGVCVVACMDYYQPQCGVCAMSYGQWFYKGIGSTQYLEQNCYHDCWECDQTSKTCTPVRYLQPQLKAISEIYDSPILEIRCEQISSYYGINLYENPGDCNAECGCCCKDGYPYPSAQNQASCPGTWTQGSCSNNPCGGCVCPSVTLSPPKKVVVTNGSTVTCMDVDQLKCGGGVCCKPDGQCSTSENTQAKCEKIGGTWRGDLDKCSKCACAQCPPLDGCSIRVRRVSRNPNREETYPMVQGSLIPIPTPTYDPITDSCVINVTVGQDVYWCTDSNGDFRIVGEDIDVVDCATGLELTCETNITATVATSGTGCQPHITSQQATGPCQAGSAFSIEFSCAYTASALEEPIYLKTGFLAEKTIERTKLTRNNYGATVANVGNIMFLDFDVIDQNNRARLYERLKEYLSSLPHTFRIYETAGGFRTICTSSNFEPDSDEALKIMRGSWTDRKYVSFCKIQKCFRTRLTPKPWRIGMRRLPEQYPRSPEEETKFKSWLEEYERRSKRFSVCKLVGDVGDPEAANPEILSFVRYHDEATRCFEDLPLEPLRDNKIPKKRNKKDSKSNSVAVQANPSTGRRLYADLSTPCDGHTGSTRVFFNVSGNCDCTSGSCNCDAGQGCDASLSGFESQDCPSIQVELSTGPRSWNCTYYGCEGVCDNSGSYSSLPACEEACKGACCLLVGGCSTVYESACDGNTGLWQKGTNCNSFSCPDTGACCNSWGGSCEVKFQSMCNYYGYTWQGAGTTCSPNPCPQPGACCYGYYGWCYSTMEENCPTWYGYTFQGPGTTCYPNMCPQPTGACCYGDGSCYETMQWSCYGSWKGLNTTCTPNTCPKPGACCNEDGTCSQTLQSNCYGSWKEGVNCDQCVVLGYKCNSSNYHGSNSGCSPTHGIYGSNVANLYPDQDSCKAQCVERFNCAIPTYQGQSSCTSVGVTDDPSYITSCDNCKEYWICFQSSIEPWINGCMMWTYRSGIDPQPPSNSYADMSSCFENCGCSPLQFQTCNGSCHLPCPGGKQLDENCNCICPGGMEECNGSCYYPCSCGPIFGQPADGPGYTCICSPRNSDCSCNCAYVPNGACCMPEGCTIKTQADCGPYPWHNSNCYPTTCIQSTGACCDQNGCSENVVEYDCQGIWQGPNTICVSPTNSSAATCYARSSDAKGPLGCWQQNLNLSSDGTCSCEAAGTSLFSSLFSCCNGWSGPNC